MTTNEILDLLLQKRQLTAPVASALAKLVEARSLAESRSKTTKWVVIGVLVLLATISQTFFLPMVFAGFAGFFYHKSRVVPIKEELARAQEIYDYEINVPEYIQGKVGFPEKFYNYRDTYRLWKLVSEGRALTLQEAYNLLETQQFQETQQAKQEEMLALQQDTASNTRWAAIAATVAAVNSSRK